MLFDVYGANAPFQWMGLIMVLAALIICNEFARRSKFGGCFMFFGVCAAMTVYCIAVEVGAAMGAEWALNNPTHTDMNSWFHYAKVYAATAGCIGFMMLKYSWGKIGRSHWFKAFPFVIVAINILIAVVSDFESAIRAWDSSWVSSEGVVLNGGIALLLAPTIAGLLWNKGGWIQNRAFTLSMWCMFCQMVPMFVNDSVFAVQSVNNPAVNTVVSVIALVANILALGYIIYRAKKLKVNPYKQEVFVGTKDFSKAMSRRADTAYLLETEPKSATPAEIAEMVAYNELPVDGEVGFVYVAKDRGEIDVDVETIKRE